MANANTNTSANKNTLAQLLPITEIQTNAPNINARDLHKALNIGRDFSNWIKARLNQANFVENQDYKTAHILIVDTPKLANQKGGDKRSINYLLSLDTAKHICLMERNNPIAHEIRRYFIDCEKALAEISPIQTRILQQRTTARIATIEPQKRLTKALQEQAIRQGREPTARLFINEAEMLNSLAIGEGVNVRSWKRAHGIAGNPRNYFTAEQLEILNVLITTDSALLEADLSFYERKTRLANIATRKRQRQQQQRTSNATE